jgi:predicted dehydrogenase
MYRIGLVGVGRWAEKITRTISSIMEDAKIVAVYQRNPKEVSWLPPDCIVYDNLSDMLRKTTLTHIITAIDPRGHYEVVEKATKYGLPIWLEKPIALSYKDTERIFSLDGDIFVDYIHLYSECFQYIKNNISNLNNIRNTAYTFGINANHNFSILYDICPHDFSILLSLFDDIKVENVHLIQSKNGDSYKIELKSNECSIFIDIGNDGSKNKMMRVEFDMNDDIFIYNGIEQKIYKNDNEIFASKELPLKRAIRAFLSGERVDKEKTLKIMKILEEIENRVR